MEFSHKAIEKKWQKYWEEHQTFKTKEDGDKKAYILDMFPYPSGAGLHVGHPKGYTATDVVARMKRLKGFDVLHPIGFDAFGLPAEQYALKTGNDPREFTAKNIEIFTTQLKKLGFSYDYNKVVNTSNPQFYKTTQWIFQQLYKKGLAEIRFANVNWCAELGTVLANEEVLNVDGKMVSEVGGFEVIKKPMKQWVLKITEYADRLLAGLDDLDWPSSVKELQRNWIGKSEGVNLNFQIDKKTVEIFTTRPDTIFGVTYIVLAPEYPDLLALTTVETRATVTDYIEVAKTKTDIDRQDISKEKTGVFTGSFAQHPITGEMIPVWVSDYVLADYGSGAVMAVPAHDKRDFKFAKKYDLPIKYVIECETTDAAFVDDGIHVASDFLNGLNIAEAKEKIKSYVAEKGIGAVKTNYKLRDWLFSRQRFYGEPFPVVFETDGSITLIDERDLPLELPKTDYIKPSGTGESPLANVPEWVNTTYNGRKVTRETNTMPQWAGSCWYYLAYILTVAPNDLMDITSEAAKKAFAKWLPVDLYIGGQEHAVLHLMYARFWHQVLFDLGIVPTPEPFQKLINQGMILDENGSKMSKSKGNVINPDDIFESHGADTLRLYEMFMGPLEASLPWSFKGLDAMRKWLDRCWRMVNDKALTDQNDGQLDFVFHSVTKKVSQMLEDCKFNTAISQLMVFVNAVFKGDGPVYREYIEKFVIMLSVFAPHVAEELWNKLGHNDSVYSQAWPQYDESKTVVSETTVAVQVNGKLKGTFSFQDDIDEATAFAKAFEIPTVQNALENKEVVKKLYIKNKIVNIVVK
jgi:leucyl-tRNA synthetase